MEVRRLLPFLALFTSASTLLCCAIPALLVSIGLGAVMAGLAANIPGLIWVSEHKLGVFILAGSMLALNGVWLWSQRSAPCPVDPELRKACLNGRKTSRIIYFGSIGVFATGAFFAYLAPLLFS